MVFLEMVGKSNVNRFFSSALLLPWLVLSGLSTLRAEVWGRSIDRKAALALQELQPQNPDVFVPLVRCDFVYAKVPGDSGIY